MAFKNKLIGYILAALGLAGLGASTVNLFPNIPKLAINIPAMILTALGIIILITTGKSSNKKSHQKEKEVPIYKGKEIVGYRVEE